MTSSGTGPCSATMAKYMAPPVMWLMMSRTVHSVQSVGLSSWSGPTPCTTRSLSPTTRSIVAKGSMSLKVMR